MGEKKRAFGSTNKRCSGLSRASQYCRTWTCPGCNATTPSPPSPVSPDGPFLANGPPPALTQFLQFNCNGLRHCTDELAHFLVTHSILVAVIQESKLTEAANPPTFPGYTLVRRGKPIGPRAGGGGLCFIVSHTVSYSPIPSDHLFPGNATAELQGISISIDGAQLHLLTSQGAPSSPDLTLISPHLALDAVWTPLARLSSDHLPISISLNSMNSPNNRPSRTYINLRRSHYDGYAADTETAFGAAVPPSSCSQGEVFFRGVLTSAARRQVNP
ncbi:hypothetical protein HAZT_HAZT011737 [Hyalella azteca]|uniref:Endonuclease/exonuclease/phosphatase domain-containing protein n=1 Tax=Hyalella azteca TaxID=294128 RepID=A0A6A0H095_HYAAZ|nr:hypothetical protein HAZT_HAZT011737 [Hyalella azteca]